jgi:hypothetical protein
MPTNNEMLRKNIIENGGELLEIELGDNERNEYKITLPLSHDFKFSSQDKKDKAIPVSCIIIRDTQTIIDVPEDAPPWRLKVIAPKDQSLADSHDSGGTPGSPSVNEPGDRLFPLLNTKAADMEEEVKKRIQNAKREIILRRQRT